MSIENNPNQFQKSEVSVISSDLKLIEAYILVRIFDRYYPEPFDDVFQALLENEPIDNDELNFIKPYLHYQKFKTTSERKEFVFGLAHAAALFDDEGNVFEHICFSDLNELKSGERSLDLYRLDSGSECVESFIAQLKQSKFQ